MEKIDFYYLAYWILIVLLQMASVAGFAYNITCACVDIPKYLEKGKKWPCAFIITKLIYMGAAVCVFFWFLLHHI